MKNQKAQEAKKTEKTDSSKSENESVNTTPKVEMIAEKVDVIAEKVEAIESKISKSTSKISPKGKKQKGEMKVTLLVNPLSVYSRKALDGKTSNIKAGTEVILTPLKDSIRVKKTNSSRTFYTNKRFVNKAIETA